MSGRGRGREREIPDDYVRMEHKICPVCTVKHSHGCGILLNGWLRSIPEEKTVTGWGLCEEHDRLNKEGFIALVAADQEKSTFKGGQLTLEGAYRTGSVAHLRRHVAAELLDIEDVNVPLIFCDDKTIEMLEGVRDKAEAESEPESESGAEPAD